MTEERHEAVYQAAQHWHEASATDTMDWEGFARWLEQDPRHRTSYDVVALTDALLDAHITKLALDQPAAVPLPIKPHFRWRRLAAGVGLAATIGFLAIMLRPETTQIYETGSAPQQIALEDGSRIDLAPHSRLELAGDDQIALEGDALFAIRHDPARALTVTAGPVRIQDIGTRFEVRAEQDSARVSVAEGDVSVAVTTAPVPARLAAGQALAVERRGAATISRADPEAVGSWTRGQLTYEDAPLSLVVKDLARYTSVQVELAPNVRAKRFSGTLATSDGKAAADDLAGIMGLALRRAGDQLRIEQR